MAAFADEFLDRLARKSKASGKDLILFDKSLPDFGLRIHPSGHKVWIMQAGRRARDMLDRIRAGRNPVDAIRREKAIPKLREFAGRVPAALRSALESLQARYRARDDVPGRGIGIARTRHQPLPWH